MYPIATADSYSEPNIQEGNIIRHLSSMVHWCFAIT